MTKQDTPPRTGERPGDTGLGGRPTTLGRYSLFLVIICAAIACVAPWRSRPALRLVWNASASAPIGLYRVSAETTPILGDLVIASAPLAMKSLAAQRRYLPLGVPLVKRIAAVPGDTICASGQQVFLNGRPLVDRHARDGAGRLMPEWNGCIRLMPRQVLLVMQNVSDSFDGRYFGPSDVRDILGKAWPVWLR